MFINTYMTKGSYLESVNYKLIFKQKLSNSIKNGQKIWTDTSKFGC